RCDGEVLLSLPAITLAAIELTEAEVTVGAERAHAAGLGERQGLAVVAFSALGTARGAWILAQRIRSREPAACGRNCASMVLRISRDTADDGRAGEGQGSAQVGRDPSSRHCWLQRPDGCR